MNYLSKHFVTVFNAGKGIILQNNLISSKYTGVFTLKKTKGLS